MYNAPAVSYPVGRSRFHGWLLATVLAVGASSLAVWTMQSDDAGLRHLSAIGLWLMTANWTIWDWFRAPDGLLIWDTKTWTWTCNEQTRQVNVSAVLDSQSVLLLHLRLSGDLPLWIWAERRMAPARWLALRRAVFSRHATLSNWDADKVAP